MPYEQLVAQDQPYVNAQPSYFIVCAVNPPGQHADHFDGCLTSPDWAHVHQTAALFTPATQLWNVLVVWDQQNIIYELAWLANRNLIFCSFDGQHINRFLRHGSKFADLGSHIMYPFHEVYHDHFIHDPHYQLPTIRVWAILHRLETREHSIGFNIQFQSQ